MSGLGLLRVGRQPRPSATTADLGKGFDARGRKTLGHGRYTFLALVARGAYAKVKLAAVGDNSGGDDDSAAAAAAAAAAAPPPAAGVAAAAAARGPRTAACATTNDDDRTAPLVAVKIYSKRKLRRMVTSLSRAASAAPLAAVAREVALLRTLDHPHLLWLHEVLDDPEEDKIYLVTDYLEGGPSMDWDPDTERFSFTPDPAEPFPRAPYYPVAEARRAVLDVLAGLAHLHHACLASHGDIKPENILRRRWRRSPLAQQSDSRPSGWCYVISDFGAARRHDAAPPEGTGGGGVRVTGTATGTYAFFAPEMCGCGRSGSDTDGGKGGGGGGYRGGDDDKGSREGGWYSPYEADVWALGVTLYAFVYGRLPFWDARGGQPLFDAILGGQDLTLPRRRDGGGGGGGSGGDGGAQKGEAGCWWRGDPTVSVGVRNLLRSMLARGDERGRRLSHTAEVAKHPWAAGSSRAGEVDEEGRKDTAHKEEDGAVEDLITEGVPFF
jgi:serine/threonine protein kinase